MENKENAQWAFIFDKLGQEQLRKMLFKAAMKKDDEGRVVIEFDGDQALNITDHVDELEQRLET